MKILILGRRIREKNILQNQQFVKSLVEESGTILHPHQNWAANNSKRHQTDEGYPDGFRKLCSTFNKLLVLKNTFFSVIDYCLELGKM